jgi:CheY-like chemotaxis protein
MENSNVIRHIFPNARFLVVDDIATNLKVSEGLLAPYEAALDTCLTGHEAIELVKRNNYDIIFMDHMMPEMDGIEATICIRQWEKESGRGKSIPIIALTANVFSDVREMFVENGFNDFLAKPIDVSKLDDILNRWIPKELRAGVKEYKPNGSVLNISGLDVDKGIKMTGGTEEGYRAVLSAYQKDAYDRLRLLKEALDKNKIPDFVIHVHAMKSASASIGADELSAAALKLETAGRAGDTVYIQENFLKFTERLEKMVENINAALDNDRNGNAAASGEDKKSGSFTELISLLRKLEAAIKQQNISEIDSLIDELSKKPLDAKTRVMLEKISDEVLMTEFEKAIKVFDELFQYHGE